MRMQSVHVHAFLPLVWLSLHTTAIHQSSLFATWLVNYLFLFTHAQGENKDLSDGSDRPRLSLLCPTTSLSSHRGAPTLALSRFELLWLTLWQSGGSAAAAVVAEERQAAKTSGG